MTPLSTQNEVTRGKAAVAVLTFEQPGRLDLEALHAELPEIGWHSYESWLRGRAEPQPRAVDLSSPRPAA